MKLQHITIIFVLIISPIAILLSGYVNAHIKTIEKQTMYNNILINATYDGVKAFQLNTANNMYSTISNSKIRDIEASVNVFFNSLASNLGVSGYTKEELKTYVPACLFTMYDGYYIYSNFYNSKIDKNGNEVGNYQYGLKPFIYYSARYKTDNNDDFIVNYTLDNTITIIGIVNGKYVVKSGHLLINDNVDLIANEILTENLIILDGDIDEKETEKFDYIVYNSQKIYKDNNDEVFQEKEQSGEIENKRYFYYSSEYKKDFVLDKEVIKYLNDHLDKVNGKYRLLSDNAINYYKESLEGKTPEDISFSSWVKKNLGDITQKNLVDEKGNPITDFITELGNERIFDIGINNNPLKQNSTFNEHRMNVIRYSIEKSLISAMVNFNEHTVIGYEFTLPKLREEEWYKLENSVCMLSFLEGISIGSKVYNNYAVVSNNTNHETVGNEDIYIIDSNKEYHKPGCKRLNKQLEEGTLQIIGAYPRSDFERKTVSVTGEDSNAHSQILGVDEGKYVYYYSQDATPCYDCIVNAKPTYAVDDIISNKVGNRVLRQWYLTGLARSRYNLYKINGYFGY